MQLASDMGPDTHWYARKHLVKPWAYWHHKPQTQSHACVWNLTLILTLQYMPEPMYPAIWLVLTGLKIPGCCLSCSVAVIWITSSSLAIYRSPMAVQYFFQNFQYLTNTPVALPGKPTRQPKWCLTSKKKEVSTQQTTKTTVGILYIWGETIWWAQCSVQ